MGRELATHGQHARLAGPRPGIQGGAPDDGVVVAHRGRVGLRVERDAEVADQAPPALPHHGVFVPQQPLDLRDGRLEDGVEGEDRARGSADGRGSAVKQLAEWRDARVERRLRQRFLERGEHWALSVAERIAHACGRGVVLGVQQGVGRGEDQVRVLSAERVFEQRQGDFADREDSLEVCGDALLQVGELADRVAGVADRGLPLLPEEGQLLDVFFEDVRDEGRDGRGHGAWPVS